MTTWDEILREVDNYFNECERLRYKREVERMEREFDEMVLEETWREIERKLKEVD